jgi:hypothetical protein
LNQKNVHGIIRHQQKGGNKRDRSGDESLPVKGLTDPGILQETGKEHILGLNIGRPRKSYVKQEVEIVKEVHMATSLGHGC